MKVHPRPSPTRTTHQTAPQIKEATRPTTVPYQAPLQRFAVSVDRLTPPNPNLTSSRARSTSKVARMCNKINRLCQCGCVIPSKQPIKHCAAGVRLGFTCLEYDPGNIVSERKSYCCARCCKKATEKAQRQLESASTRYEAAVKKGDQRAKKQAEGVMRLANNEFGRESAKHDRCMMERERDVY